MNGAVAAGHPLTAGAGARILAEGGNAVDACIAAALVSWVAESPLTGPGAGGFMLVHRARDRSDRLLDFFVESPGRGLTPAPEPSMEAVDVAFDPANLQRFFLGGGSCAIPGTVVGLAEAHRLYGTIPWSELFGPAIEHARAGVELSSEQAALHAILDPVLRYSPDLRAIYGVSAPLASGERLPMKDLAPTLEVLAEEGARAFYEGELAARIVECVRAAGGAITREDLAAYRVIRRMPVRAAYRGHEFVSNPPPSSGGLLIAYALAVLDCLGPPERRGSVEEVERLAGAMQEANRARDGRFTRSLYRGGLAAALLSKETVEAAAGRVRAGQGNDVPEPARLPSTTHISVVDAAGNAASHSASTGCGSGVLVPGTGIHLNNMLGEVDLMPPGTRRAPGRRLTSMMSPSLVLRGTRPLLVLGSAGSERLRAAILQIVVNVLDHGLGVDEAIAAPRIHVEAGRLHLEAGFAPELGDRLSAARREVVRWGGFNLFFGGVSAVALSEDGRLDAAGDPRRGGAGIVVE